MKKTLLLIACVIVLGGCVSKEEKAKIELLEKINTTWELLNSACEQSETVLSVPVGFELDCTEAEFQKHCNIMIEKNGGHKDGNLVYINSDDFGSGKKEVRISNFHYFSDPNIETNIVSSITFIFDEYRDVYDNSQIVALIDSISNKFDGSWQTMEFQLEPDSKSLKDYYKYWIKGNQVAEFKYGFNLPVLTFYNMPKYGVEHFKNNVKMLLEIKHDVKKRTEKREKAPKIENSSWDGSVSQVKKYLKQNLKDPDSYEGMEWSGVKKTGTGYMVRHKYRAKNSFGGYVIENKVFLLNEQGVVVSTETYE